MVFRDGTTPLPPVTYTEENKQFKPTKSPQIFQTNPNKKINNYVKNKVISNRNFDDINNNPATEVPVNFKSQYQATTPVFPLNVDVTPPTISEDQLPPFQDINQQRNNQENSPPPNIVDLIKPPSKYYEPPNLSVQTSGENFETQTASAIVETTVKSNIINDRFNNKNNQNFEWNKLRRMFLIPDYEFPLDHASRPSYDESVSSFQVNPFVVESKSE